ncbi:MAG: membrane protein insertion efficiency factor YidD [Bacilli bacterium]|nr:membrane protein insertion efficiency factor YidD [Bacilli bacterium]
MNKLLIRIIKIYQSMPISTHNKCRFKPTCSQYMIDAINMYGSYKGLKLGIKRILRCHPFGKYGYDPVKENL